MALIFSRIGKKTKEAAAEHRKVKSVVHTKHAAHKAGVLFTDIQYKKHIRETFSPLADKRKRSSS